MAITRVGGGGTQLDNATSSTIAWPTTAAGDLAIVTFSYYENGGRTVTTPTDFTQRLNAPYAGTPDTDTETRIVVFTKECTGSESGNLTVACSDTVYAGITLDVYRGDGTLSYTSISSPDTGSSTDATAPSVSGTSGQLLLAIYAISDPPGTTNSGPSGMTIGADFSGGTTNSARNYYQVLSSTGATGSKTWDFTNTRAWGGASMLVTDSGGGGIDITPSAGSLVITGQVPTVSVVGAVAISTGVGSVVLTGQVPRVQLRQKVQPLIEPADSNVSGSNTASSTWAVVHPAISAGDLGIVYIAWDDSTNVTSVVPPTGAGGGTFTAYSTAPITDSATETRAKLWWYVATGAASASSIAFKPSAGSESWSATWVRVPAGEFDPTTPIGSTMGLGSASTSAVTSPSMNAGVSDGQGTLLWFVGVDTDNMSASVATAGWTTLETQDLGAVGHGVARRDAPVTDSAAYSAGAFVWNMSGTNQDTWTGILAIVRAPPVPEVVYPETGSVVIAGQMPTVSVPATGNYSASTLSGALTLTGQVPTITRDYAVSTGVGAITLTGVLPTVSVASTSYTVNTLTGSISITGYAPDQTFETDPPGSGQLILTGQVPTVSLGAVPVSVSTLAGSLVISGQAPTVGRDFSVNSGAGSIALAGVAPSVTRDFSASTGAGAITLTGVAPTVSVGLVPVSVPTFSGSLTIAGQAPTVLASQSVSTLAGSLVITGVAPTLTRDYTASTAAGSLTIGGQVPTISTGNNPNVGTLSGQIVLTGVSPTVKRDYTVSTLAGSLTISGNAPTATRDYTVETLTGELVIAGYVPVLSQGGSLNALTASGQIIISGEAPQVINSGDPLPSRQTGGGTSRRRKRYQKPYVVEIDGEDFVVSSAAEAEALLAKAQETAEELLVDVRVSPTPVAPKAPRIRVKGPAGPDLTELVGMVSETREAIRELYLIARNAEIGVLMRKIEDDDEDDALTALLMH